MQLIELPGIGVFCVLPESGDRMRLRGISSPACTAMIDTPVSPIAVTFAKSADTAGPVQAGNTIARALITVVTNSQATGRGGADRGPGDIPAASVR